MRKVSSATVATILAIALYFTLFWGYDALRVLTSPTYGLEDVWRSQFVFGLGSLFKLSPIGLIKLAAFFGTVKLAVAVICAVHIADRVRVMAGGKANSDVLEGGLILVVAISIVSVAPAILAQNADLMREQLLQLLLAGLAAGLSLFERSQTRRAGIGKLESAPAATADATAVSAAPRVHA
jgi:hypothetical protein